MNGSASGTGRSTRPRFEALLRGQTDRRGMDIDRETVEEIAVSVLAVGLFVAVIVGIGTAFSPGGAELSNQGALVLVGAIAAFVLLMTGVGYVLSGR